MLRFAAAAAARDSVHNWSERKLVALTKLIARLYANNFVLIVLHAVS